MKEHLIAIEDLCNEALESGASTLEEFYLYVSDRLENVTREQVEYVLDRWRD